MKFKGDKEIKLKNKIKNKLIFQELLNKFFKL